MMRRHDRASSHLRRKGRVFRERNHPVPLVEKGREREKSRFEGGVIKKNGGKTFASTLEVREGRSDAASVSTTRKKG